MLFWVFFCVGAVVWVFELWALRGAPQGFWGAFSGGYIFSSGGLVGEGVLVIWGEGVVSNLVGECHFKAVQIGAVEVFAGFYAGSDVVNSSSFHGN